VSVQLGQTLCQDVRDSEYGEEITMCIYIISAFSFSLKYIDLDKKHYFDIQAFVYKDILSLDRQYAPAIIVLSCNCVRVAVYCVIALLLIGNCPEDRILFK
jgi:ABC-type Mn2+/Zn2+ transport system permease subunit